MSQVRPAAVAGQFYPGDPNDLRQTVLTLLAAADPQAPASNTIKALVVPHAGYPYSGPVAASAYRLLEGRDVTRVVLLGPSHRQPLRGLALPRADAFETPLGQVPLDRAAMDDLQQLPQVVVDPLAHASEHAIEVQLPFLQLLLGSFSLVPLAVGEAAPEAVAQVLERLWGGPETLIVVSSDLSHYLPYHLAKRLDAATAQAILALADERVSHSDACGATPIQGLLRVARQHGMGVELIDLRNSGDTGGDRQQVVGYGSFAFLEAA